jgi:hypothetical protein
MPQKEALLAAAVQLNVTDAARPNSTLTFESPYTDPVLASRREIEKKRKKGKSYTPTMQSFSCQACK